MWNPLQPAEFEKAVLTRDHKPTQNMICARFTHDSSRALDPHLHTHCILFNATHEAGDGVWKALENCDMHNQPGLLEGLKPERDFA